MDNKESNKKFLNIFYCDRYQTLGRMSITATPNAEPTEEIDQHESKIIYDRFTIECEPKMILKIKELEERLEAELLNEEDEADREFIQALYEGEYERAIELWNDTIIG